MVSGKIFIQILPSRQTQKKLVGISHYGHFKYLTQKYTFNGCITMAIIASLCIRCTVSLLALSRHIWFLTAGSMTFNRVTCDSQDFPISCNDIVHIFAP
jgi:hypothetical protein